MYNVLIVLDTRNSENQEASKIYFVCAHFTMFSNFVPRPLLIHQIVLESSQLKEKGLESSTKMISFLLMLSWKPPTVS